MKSTPLWTRFALLLVASAAALQLGCGNATRVTQPQSELPEPQSSTGLPAEPEDGLSTEVNPDVTCARGATKFDDVGYWRNWRRHYSVERFEAIVAYARDHIAPDLYQGGSPLTVEVVDAVFTFGRKTSRDQMLLARTIALSLDVAVTHMAAEGLEKAPKRPLCMLMTADISRIPLGAEVFWDTQTPSINAVLYAMALYWGGRLTTSRADWVFSFPSKQHAQAALHVVAGILEGRVPVQGTCP